MELQEFDGKGLSCSGHRVSTSLSMKEDSEGPQLLYQQRFGVLQSIVPNRGIYFVYMFLPLSLLLLLLAAVMSCAPNLSWYSL